MNIFGHGLYTLIKHLKLKFKSNGGTCDKIGSNGHLLSNLCQYRGSCYQKVWKLLHYGTDLARKDISDVSVFTFSH